MASFLAFNTDLGTEFVNVNHISTMILRQDGSLQVNTTSNHHIEVDKAQSKEFLGRITSEAEPGAAESTHTE